MEMFLAVQNQTPLYNGLSKPNINFILKFYAWEHAFYILT
jgi:hypothetical protein